MNRLHLAAQDEFGACTLTVYALRKRHLTTGSTMSKANGAQEIERERALIHERWKRFRFTGATIEQDEARGWLDALKADSKSGDAGGVR